MTTFALLAHAGHAGDHGWLAGALQPLLGLDHFVAGLLVAVVLSLLVARVALRVGVRSGTPPGA